ncbi:MAG: hypothetical protein HOP12_02305 [Candidatus Eisenbacteria bacterium]|uniref:Apea-like HEPN domain-containing protein n=1 Tax=Eiseniibacteriota bacterium TaxID=2212470 RepID=A0A849SC79_UNCEI|nr:hypothetical protein [Candidatus Eisenbacteria bacterium]
MLQTLEYLAFEGVPDGGLELDDYLRLGTKPAISRELMEKRFFDLISKREGEELVSRPSFLFNLTRTTPPNCDELTGHAITRNFLVRSQIFMLALWLVRDNSGNPGSVFFMVNNEDGSDNSLSERHSAYYFTAECTLVHATFTRSELDTAIGYMKQLDAIIPKVARALEAGRPTGLVHASRIARCLYFAQAARGADDPSVKAAFYCICFETLFSTDINGVAHRVAERSAFLLGTTGTERREIYKNIHDLYGYRSTVVHGGHLKQKDEAKLRAVVVLGDAHLRNAILKIIENEPLLNLFGKNDEGAIREHFFNELFPTN